jgi:plasmid stabilization system protein ParE
MNSKHYRVLIPKSVEIILQKQADYIVKEQRAPSIATQWLDGIFEAIESLSQFPDRCSIAPENFYVKKDSNIVIRHLIYKKSFRVIFTVVKNEVRILSAKHATRLV